MRRKAASSSSDLGILWSSRKETRSVRPGLLVALLVVAMLISFFTARRIADGLGYLTGGDRLVDVVAGLALTIGPGGLALATASISQRAGHARTLGLYVLALWAPALALLPYARGVDLDPALVATINHRIPDVTVGLVVGEVVVVVVGIVVLIRAVSDGPGQRGSAQRRGSWRR